MGKQKVKGDQQKNTKRKSKSGISKSSKSSKNSNSKNIRKEKGGSKLGKRSEKEGRRKSGGVRSTLHVDIKQIKNKRRRINILQRQTKERERLKKLNKLKKKKIREELGEEAMPKIEPTTVDNTRVYDETFITEEDSEIKNEEEMDEFLSYFKEGVSPRLLLTTCRRPSGKLFAFLKEIHATFPQCEYYPRKNFQIKKIIEFAKNQQFTDIFIFGNKSTTPNSLVLIHLPDGPTATFNLTRPVLNKHIHHHGNITGHLPEVILNNFDTRLGRRIGRMFAAVFPQNPQFEGRRVVTFHNQRDFIFFRQHRYIFDEEKEKAHLQELGPRFTLRLTSLQKGTFDTKFGEFEWIYRADMDVNKRKMFL